MGRAGSADFFELQDDARKATRRLLPLFLLAVAGVAAALSFLASIGYTIWVLYVGGPVPAGVMLDYSHIIRSFFSVLLKGVPWQLYAAVGGGAMALMLGASMRRMWQLREGGEAVADLMGADLIARNFATPMQNRLLNIVEEMAIASGVAVPPVYTLAGERAINALAAGYAPNEAVIIVTQGAVEKLTRDELQGVIAHEFSHILNGDMRLNVQLLALLYGVVFIGQTGRNMMNSSTEGALGVKREAQRILFAQLSAGIMLAGIGHLGLLAARFIKAAISQQREFLADAASVQFTRNPDGIAGALDSTRSLRVGTHVWNPHAEEVSHMFFGQAVSTALGPSFATHPPIDERIRRVHPRFMQQDYRDKRTGIYQQRAEVAVIDALGNVVKTVNTTGAVQGLTAVTAIAAVAGATVGHPGREHLDAASRLLARVPPALRERMKNADGAAQIMFALVLEADESSRLMELAALLNLRGEVFTGQTREAYGEMEKLSRAFAFPLVEMALPVLKAGKQEERDRFLADLGAVVESDRRVTLSEFALHTFLKQHLREGAGRPVASKYRKIAEIVADAHLLLSLVAHVSAGDTAAAFSAGAPMLDLEHAQPLPQAEISTARVAQALERLRLLNPLLKPRVLRACVDAAAAEGGFRLIQAEMVRVIAATLDCPVPPVLATLDPATLG